jgi:hypothetical protein
MLCPWKIEDRRLYRHLRKGACSPGNGLAALDGGWHEAIDEGPQSRWRDVEREAWGEVGPPINPAEIPRVAAVVFEGVVDGKHRCRPATAAEAQQETPIDRQEGGIFGRLCKAASRYETN